MSQNFHNIQAKLDLYLTKNFTISKQSWIYTKLTLLKIENIYTFYVPEANQNV